MSGQDKDAYSIGLLARIVWLNATFWVIAPVASILFAAVALSYVRIYGLIVGDRRKYLRLARRTLSWYGAMVIRCAWPLVRIRFIDQSPGDTPPFVFVANHRSSSDAFLMAVLSYECIEVLNIWPSRIPIVNILSRAAGYLRVREMPFEEFLEKGTALLNEGASIITFPEGTRSGSARLGQFHGSAFRLAQKAGVKIVPLAVFGNENIPPRGSLLLRPGRIVITKLPAVTCEQYKDMTPFRLKTSVRESISRVLEAQIT
jgi:1-acyl-sn-glycerol-3-phosphate acyltransferase